METRLETVQALKALMHDGVRQPVSNVYSQGELLLSDIPKSCRSKGVLVGIDEAGRGSVLGPMIYGAAYWNASDAALIPKDFNDSKQLTEPKRAVLLEKILATNEMGFVVRVLSASEISRNMLRPNPYNLNQMSHDAAIQMIRSLVKEGVQIDTCYIDTVGNPASYKRRLEMEFPNLNFVVESKADANYAPCSAGSVGTLRGNCRIAYTTYQLTPIYYFTAHTFILSYFISG
jgi:ribonuclease H2 subunit A